MMWCVVVCGGVVVWCGGSGSDVVYDVCVSPYAPTMHAPNLGGRTPQSQTPSVPATTSPALMAGVNPGRCTCVHGQKKTPHELIMAMMS